MSANRKIDEGYSVILGVFLTIGIIVCAVIWAAKSNAAAKSQLQEKGVSAHMVVTEHYASGQKRVMPHAVVTVLQCCEGGKIEYVADGLSTSSFEKE